MEKRRFSAQFCKATDDEAILNRILEAAREFNTYYKSKIFCALCQATQQEAFLEEALEFARSLDDLDLISMVLEGISAKGELLCAICEASTSSVFLEEVATVIDTLNHAYSKKIASWALSKATHGKIFLEELLEQSRKLDDLDKREILLYICKSTQDEDFLQKVFEVAHTFSHSREGYYCKTNVYCAICKVSHNSALQTAILENAPQIEFDMDDQVDLLCSICENAEDENLLREALAIANAIDGIWGGSYGKRNILKAICKVPAYKTFLPEVLKAVETMDSWERKDFITGGFVYAISQSFPDEVLSSQLFEFAKKIEDDFSQFLIFFMLAQLTQDVEVLDNLQLELAQLNYYFWRGHAGGILACTSNWSLLRNTG